TAALGRGFTIEDVRVLRHKPGRRALIAFQGRLANGDSVTVLGKVRARGLDERTPALLTRLRARGLHEGAPDGVAVPEPLGLVPELAMWLQRLCGGRSASQLLPSDGAAAAGARIAQALVRLQTTGVVPERIHTIEDEMRILH